MVARFFLDQNQNWPKLAARYGSYATFPGVEDWSSRNLVFLFPAENTAVQLSACQVTKRINEDI